MTTVKEYSFKPAERLPEIKEASRYKPLEDNTVRFALNVWAGWAPIILANNGIKAEKVWKTPDGEEFKVELVIIDNPVAMLDAYTTGNVHIGWGTLDMVPLFVDGMVDKTGRPKEHFDGIMPRIFQQIDWSNGGDGIVVRDNIKTVADLRDKKLVLAQNSPSQYFALNMLVAGGVQPSEVDMIYTNDAFAGGRGLRCRQAEDDRRRRLLVARHLQPGEGQGQPHAGQHADGQQADRRRLVRPGRLCQGPSRHHRGPGPRHLRRAWKS